MKKINLTYLVTCLALSVSVQASEVNNLDNTLAMASLNRVDAVDPIDIDPQASEPALTKKEVEIAKTSGPDNAYTYVTEKAQSYIDKKRRKFSKQNKQVFMHSGSAIVALKPTENGWSSARILAYQEAQQKARERLLKQLYTDVTVETIRTSFKTNKLPEFTPEEIQTQSRLEAFWDKLVALSDAQVSKKLEELGIDPKIYDAASPTKRKNMMKKAITKTVGTRSYGDISGSQIMKTYEKTDSDGNTAISVIIASSNKKKSFLNSLRFSKGNIQANESKAKQSVEDYLAKNKDNLMYQYGTKVLWDEKGYPVLLSFGMSGNECNPSDYEECVDNREFSLIEAELDAFSHISESYNLTGSVKSQSSSTKDKSKNAAVSIEAGGNSEAVETTIARIIKETKQQSKMTSAVKGLVGLKQVTRWTDKHPITNREVNGVVLMWHPLAELETRAFKENKIIDRRSDNAAKVVIQAGAGESDEADDEDF